MAKIKRKSKRRGRIRIKESAQLVHKNDKTRVSKDTIGGSKVPRMETQMPRNAGATFKVKIRKK